MAEQTPSSSTARLGAGAESRMPRNWFPAPGEPHDRCFRCGRPTPLGVSLCERDNPGRVKAPSPTQMHGTIALGVVGGFIGFMLLAALMTRGVGPFAASIASQARQADGALAVVVEIANEGSRQAAASCRVSRGGVAGGGELVFFTEPIPAGETTEYSGLLPPGTTSSPASQLSTVVVRCN